MFLSSRHELFVLLGTFIGGLVLGLVFDIFRIYRKNFKGASSFVWLQDVLMWAVMLVVVYVTVFITNSAQIRWYEFAGFGAGVAVYMVVLSTFVVMVSSAVIGIIKKIFSFVFLIIMFPFRLIWKLLSRPVKFIIKWLKTLFRRFFQSQKSNFLRFYRIFKKI